MRRGDRIIVKHGDDGEALASVQRFVVEHRTFKVRKLRKSGLWSKVLTIPKSDYLRHAPIEEDHEEDRE